MDTFNVVDEENFGSNIFHVKKATEKSGFVLPRVPNARKKSFKTDNAGNKLEKPVRTALVDLANMKKVESFDLKPKASSKQTSHQLKTFKFVNSISETKEEEWSDIEEMHIYEEPEDDYEDILPKHERVSITDVENLWVSNPGFSRLPASPEQRPDISMANLWFLTPPNLSDDSKFLDYDFFGEREMKLVPLRLDYSDSEDL